MAVLPRLLLSLVALASASMAGAAGVYKCAQPDGRVVFSEHPCTTDQSGSAMKGVTAASPVAVDGSGGGNNNSAKNAPLDSASCQKLRLSLDADRARLGRMTDKEKIAFVTQQNEVSVACR